MNTKTKSSSYPRGLFTISIVNAANMAALAMINALVVLYCTHQLHLTLTHSYAIFAAFGAIFYAAALMGGYIGGRYDYMLSIILGCALAGSGGYFLAVGAVLSMYLGLACFIVGCGLIVPNLYVVIGKLYAKTDPRRDSGFTVAYIVSNLGSMISAFSSGYIVNTWGFHTAFFLGSTVVLLSMFLFLLTYKRYDFYKDEKTPVYKPDFSWGNFFPIVISIIISVPAVRVMLNYARFSNVMLLVLGFVMIFVVIRLALKEKGRTRNKLLTFLAFLIVGTAFWALYMLAPSALTIFIRYNVNRTIGHFTIPTPSLYGLNPLYILTFGTLTSMFFLWLAKHKRTFSIPGKYSLGIISMGLGYVVLFVGIHFADNLGMIALVWVLLSYFFQTFGELFIGPITFAMVGALCPSKLEGLMTGVFRMSVGVAGAASGFLAEATAAPKSIITEPLKTNPIFQHSFGLYGVITLVVGISVLLIAPRFKRLWE